MSKEEDDAQHERNLQSLESARNYVRPRMRRAERIYNQALTSLWLGNAGAALAALSFVGAASQKGHVNQALLIPLGCFVLGVVAIGAGTAISLYQEGKALNDMQRALGVWDFKVDQIKASTDQIGLTFDWRTGLVILSAVFFCLGCVIGVFELWISN
jgi:hypothetical protein